ncbi:hypothetical protein [Oceanobacillus halotolerans]|uniref:hypothetical protein n=1 Tax=Oceanobacillus halotolerans TaxID=2663380 RepID=UPI0013D9A82F|nr:hypothetical protein [Oceanobacillus halotolerans]
MEQLIDKKNKKLEALLWSIALPGFAQLLNEKYIKGLLFVGLEIIVNVMGNFNKIIILSYHGNIQGAIEQTNYQWLMFYPCLYFFTMWDAYRDASDDHEPFIFLPFVFGAYFVTLGLIFSPSFSIFGFLIGPMWLPIFCLPIGLVIGFILRRILLKKYS